MKTLGQIILTCIVITGLAMTSCTNSTHNVKNNELNLSGNWKDEGGHYLTIKMEGENYSIHSYTYWNNQHSEDHDYFGKYKDGKIDIGNPAFKGDITYSKESDKLYWSGRAFTRTKEQH
jgi:hypothetical protein